MALFDFCEKCYPKLCYCRQNQKPRQLKYLKEKQWQLKKSGIHEAEEAGKQGGQAAGDRQANKARSHGRDARTKKEKNGIIQHRLLRVRL